MDSRLRMRTLGLLLLLTLVAVGLSAIMVSATVVRGRRPPVACPSGPCRHRPRLRPWLLTRSPMVGSLFSTPACGRLGSGFSLLWRDLRQSGDRVRLRWSPYGQLRYRPRLSHYRRRPDLDPGVDRFRLEDRHGLHQHPEVLGNRQIW